LPLTLHGTADTALIVIDMQNGFCHPDGSLGKLGFDVSMCQEAIPGCEHLVREAHRAGVPVIFTRYVYRADYKDGGVLVREVIPALSESNSLAAGSWDAHLIDELVPQEQDFVVDKNRYSAFYATSLDSILSSLRVTNLVLAGVTTNMCVETTARDASQRDYRVFVVSDATGELDRARHDMALNTIGFGFGAVVESAEVVASWAHP